MRSQSSWNRRSILLQIQRNRQREGSCGYRRYIPMERHRIQSRSTDGKFTFSRSVGDIRTGHCRILIKNQRLTGRSWRGRCRISRQQFRRSCRPGRAGCPGGTSCSRRTSRTSNSRRTSRTGDSRWTSRTGGSARWAGGSCGTGGSRYPRRTCRPGRAVYLCTTLDFPLC